MLKSLKFGLILKGILAAAILAMFLSLILGVLTTYTSLPESEMSNNIIICASIFISAFITAYKAGTKGMYHGLSVGLGFLLLIVVLSAVFWPHTPSLVTIGEKAVFALVSGGIGGIIGMLIPQG